MDAMKLFMAIPGRINFLQMGRYGKFSEQTYRNHFVNESFDWFSFNEHLVKEHLPGKRKAIADPSYIPVRKENPMAGIFLVKGAGEYKRGLEIMGIGVLDVDNRECMTLGSVQSPDTKTLDNMDKSLLTGKPVILQAQARNKYTVYPTLSWQMRSFQRAHSSRRCVQQRIPYHQQVRERCSPVLSHGGKTDWEVKKPRELPQGAGLYLSAL